MPNVSGTPAARLAMGNCRINEIAHNLYECDTPKNCVYALHVGGVRLCRNPLAKGVNKDNIQIMTQRVEHLRASMSDSQYASLGEELLKMNASVDTLWDAGLTVAEMHALKDEFTRTIHRKRHDRL